MFLTVTMVLLIALCAAMAAALIWLAAGQLSARQDKLHQADLISKLAEQVALLNQNQQALCASVNEQAKNSQQYLATHLTAASQTLAQLHQHLGKLESESKQLNQLAVDMRQLQTMLTAPKLRGQLGETSLASLLENILPAGSFRLQHTFANKKMVDALVTLPRFSVPIDSKFPLASFQKMMAASTEEEKEKLRRQFQADLRGHIDKIADSYIRPDEGTLDFALMFIPAENVYYEAIVHYQNDKTNIQDYALQKKVIPVSPNLLYAYLMTIAMGLQGMMIEKQAAVIRRQIRHLADLFKAFDEKWQTLGRHLKNAGSQYDQAAGQVAELKLRLEQIARSDVGAALENNPQ